MNLLIIILSILGASTFLAMRQAPLWTWGALLAVATLGLQFGVFSGEFSGPDSLVLTLLGWLPAAGVLALCTPSIRHKYFVVPAFKAVKKILPKVSDTEQAALAAGTVGWDAELFSGQPDWDKLHEIPAIELTDEEQAFIDGPTEQLCALINDWDIRHNQKEVPQEIWDFVAQHGFLGMLISKEHGGLGFSAQAQSLVLGKIASRSPDVATIVMVPNSLGPGELIEKYGTDEQKDYYLPRLAKGKEIPCFGLTGPTSGSDAATMRDVGVVCKYNSEEDLGLRLNWEKRYISLGPNATLLGIAFEAVDPDNLLGKGANPGITLALVPADHENVDIGRRHLPCGTAFPNGPNWGRDVMIPMEWVIGGEAMVGRGWHMLMECLSAGRSISLPASGTAGTKSLLRVTTAYARIRKQFGIPIARMEGIEEAMSRMVEGVYLNESSRAVTAAMVARGEKPSVISALLKYQSTERLRNCVNDAMDIHGGRAVIDGPSNYLQAVYQMVPVGITVEGANILTRSLITFAQGALRSHPFLYSEISAVQDPDTERGLQDFETAFLGHISFSVSNFFAAPFHNLTAGRFAGAPETAGSLSHWYRQLARASRNFALMADLTVALLGGGLKIKQKITGRMADALSELYLLSCILKRYDDDGRPASDRAILDYCAENTLYRFQEAIRGTIDNFPVKWARVFMRALVFPLGARFRPASDAAGKAIVKLVSEPGEVRDRLTRHIYITDDPDDPIGLLEYTFPKVIAAEAIEKKIEKAIRAGTIERYHDRDWIAAAVEKGVVSEEEAATMREVDELVARVIAVDDFAPEAIKPHYQSTAMTDDHAENLSAAE